MCSALTPCLEEKTGAEGRTSLCQHIHGTFLLSLCVCARLCDVFQALGREVNCIVQNGKKKSDVSGRSS